MRPMLEPQADEPAWSRPALIAVVLLAAGLMLADVTRSGYGNTYYATGAFAASRSWHALLTNAADLGDYVSLDKGPLPDWLMGLSGRLLGFGSFSVMVPNALYAIATVIVLHDAVRRALGYEIAILAALIMALTPVAVLVGRYNAPDALLVGLLVGAAWSVTVAVQSGRVRELLMCAVLVGLAFNTKMLEAYLVAPALALAFLVARRAPLRRRLGELALAGGLTLLVSVVWFGSMMLVPAGQRPYVGDSSDNSWFQLILGGNGVQRVTGSGGAFGRNVAANLLYLFGAHIAGQVAWLLPLALAGLLVGLLTTWRSRSTSIAFAAYVLWSTWALVCVVVLSFSAGTRHAYYTSILAPAVATLAAAALVMLWRAARESALGALALALAIVGSATVSFAVLGDAAGFLPWLRWVVLACGAIAAAVVLTGERLKALRASAATSLAAGTAAIALLGGPAAYSLATVDREHAGYDPTAGPALNASRPMVALASEGVLTSLRAPSFASSLTVLTVYLRAHRGHTRFLVAATDGKTADPIALASHQLVITVGGFTGADPTPTVDQLEQLIRSRQLRYVLLDASRVMPNSKAQARASVPAWVERHCARVADAAILAAARPAQRGSQISSKLALFDGCE
jgi:4-amino-4-deoxy-L-arabinose transferase-like glycosyltransferase